MKPQKKQIVKMKVCVIGNPGVGKTHLIHTLTQSDEPEIPTEEYEVSIYCLEAKSAIMEIQLWDCSSHYSEFHKYLRQAFFRNSSAALLMIDVTHKDWQQQAHSWISEAYDNQCYLVYAVATNMDKYLENKWQDDLGKSLSSPFLSEFVEGIKERAEKLFKQYEIRMHFLERRQSINKHFEELFMTMHDESLIVSRGSMARGLASLPAIEEESSNISDIFREALRD